MKVLTFLLLMLVPFCFTNAQRIGKLAPDKPHIEFPDNSWGADIMFGEGGFGLGTFYKKSFSLNLSGFVDVSLSEAKDSREIEYVDYYGNTFVLNKKNRIFYVPLNFGLQYRLFTNVLTDSFRPYLTAGVGPSFILTNPYEREFFNAIGHTQVHYAAGGYAGLGADIGTSTSSLIGLNVRYYYSHLFTDGVESLIGNWKKDFGGLFISLSIGIMY